jgi:hypothetical protein
MGSSSPAAGNDDRLSGRRREANAADPLGVALLGGASSDSELAVTEGVPQLDGLFKNPAENFETTRLKPTTFVHLVARSRDDLAVVDGEGNGQNILGVAVELTGGGSGVQIP